MARTTDDGPLGHSRSRGSPRKQAEVEKEFRETFFILDRRISLFLCLPLKTLDSMALKKELNSIGQTLTPVTKE